MVPGIITSDNMQPVASFKWNIYILSFSFLHVWHLYWIVYDFSLNFCFSVLCLDRPLFQVLFLYYSFATICSPCLLHLLWKQKWMSVEKGRQDTFQYSQLAGHENPFWGGLLWQVVGHEEHMGGNMCHRYFLLNNWFSSICLLPFWRVKVTVVVQNRRQASKRTHICDCFLCLLLCISGFLNAVFNFSL